MGKSGLIGGYFPVVAEGMAAVETVVVFEKAFIDDLAQFGASHSTGGAAEQSTEDGTGDAADADADRAGDHADRGAETRTAKGAGRATGGTADQADRAAGLLAVIERFNVAGIAKRAFQSHGCSPVSRIKVEWGAAHDRKKPLFRRGRNRGCDQVGEKRVGKRDQSRCAVSCKRLPVFKEYLGG